MLKIKLARFGKRNQPHYRIVVIEAKTKRDGKYTASLGHYAPTQTPKVLEIDAEAFTAWVKKGAQPTDTVSGLFERFKSGTPFPPKKATPSKKAKAKQAEAAKQAAEAPVAEATPEVAAPEAPSEAATPTEEVTTESK